MARAVLLMRVKICGLCRPEDARLAAACGADYGGVILAPGGPRSQTVAMAGRILEAAGDLARVGVFVDASVDDVAAAARSLDLAVVQLHGSESPAQIEALHMAGRWRVWKAIRPRTGDAFLAGLAMYAPFADGLLVDGWSATFAGGGGVAFDWAAVARHRERVPPGIELIAAGGLTPGNVMDAIVTLGPDAVDVSSGVEAERCVKSAAMVQAFIEGAKQASSRTTVRQE